MCICLGLHVHLPWASCAFALSFMEQMEPMEQMDQMDQMEPMEHSKGLGRGLDLRSSLPAGKMREVGQVSNWDTLAMERGRTNGRVLGTSLPKRVPVEYLSNWDTLAMERGRTNERVLGTSLLTTRRARPKIVALAGAPACVRLGAGPESAVCTSDAAAASVLAGPQAQMLETPQAQMRSQALLRLCLRNWERLTQRKRSSEEAILNAAGEAILGFWLIRGGGGAGGDAALAAEFFQNGNERLDAQQLEDRLNKVLGVHLEPAHSGCFWSTSCLRRRARKRQAGGHRCRPRRCRSGSISAIPNLSSSKCCSRTQCSCTRLSHGTWRGDTG